MWTYEAQAGTAGDHDISSVTAVGILAGGRRNLNSQCERSETSRKPSRCCSPFTRRRRHSWAGNELIQCFTGTPLPRPNRKALAAVHRHSASRSQSPLVRAGLSVTACLGIYLPMPRPATGSRSGGLGAANVIHLTIVTARRALPGAPPGALSGQPSWAAQTWLDSTTGRVHTVDSLSAATLTWIGTAE